MGSHYHKRKNKSKNRSFELVMDVIAIMGPLVTLPQMLEVLRSGQNAGLSLTTWVGYLALSVFWFSYGINKKEKPIIIANGLYLVVNSIIVAGLLVL